MPLIVLLVGVVIFGVSFFAKPDPAVSQATPTVIFLTTGSTWTVPTDWNSSNNTIEVIGGGAAGGAVYPNAVGGGGGAYSKTSNVTLAPGTSVTYRVGTAGTSKGAGGDTYFCNSTSNCASIAGSAVVVGAKGGGASSGGTPGTGGAAASGVGATKYSGGSGGSSTSESGGGGGGAAGPHGNGAKGGNTNISLGGDAGAGGGGANGGFPGNTNPTASTAGSGGNNRFGSGGGAPGGGVGSNGGGGGGGSNYGNGGNGSQEAVWTATAGPTAGPGSGGGGSASGATGGSGGGYGGAGGGSRSSTSPAGAPGIIVITYTPEQTVPAAPSNLNATADADSIELTWTAPSSDGGSPVTAYKIYRGTSPNPTSLLTISGTSVTYSDQSAAIGTRYYYRIVAVNAIGDSPYSNEDNDLIPFPPGLCTLVSGGTPITGYAWSDTIGWIDMSCQNSGVCASNNFGLSIANDGSISGCAWSEHVGWVSAAAEDLTGCPSGICSARMNELALEGWMKVLSANDAQSGGWDGFISLSGTSPSYGPTLAGGMLSGYAWGDTNVGWLSFDAGTDPVATEWVPSCATQYSCVDSTSRQSACTNAPVEACNPGLICSAGACVLPPAPFTAPGSELKVSPNLASYHQTVVVSWDVQEADSCTVTENNPDFTDTWDTLSGAETSSPITRVTTYTLSCTGPGGDLTQTATVSRRPEWREI